MKAPIRRRAPRQQPELGIQEVVRVSDLSVLSFGGGQDSDTILRLLALNRAARQRWAPGRLVVVFSDTGNEHVATYRHLLRIVRFCRRHGIEFVWLHPRVEISRLYSTPSAWVEPDSETGYHSGAWRSLTHQWTRNSTVGSVAYRSTCSIQLKALPIGRYLAALLRAQYGAHRPGYQAIPESAARRGRIRLLLGYAAGEEHRFSDPEKHEEGWMASGYAKEFPLVELGWSRMHCQQFTRMTGVRPPPPSLCRYCMWASDAQLELMRRVDSRGLAAWSTYETTKKTSFAARGTPADRNLGVKGKIPLPVVVERAKTRYGDWSTRRLARHCYSHGHNVCSRH